MAGLRKRPAAPQAPQAPVEAEVAVTDPYAGRRRSADFAIGGGGNLKLRVNPNIELLKTHELYIMNDEGMRLHSATEDDDWQHVTYAEIGGRTQTGFNGRRGRNLGAWRERKLPCRGEQARETNYSILDEETDRIL
jgi:hypothetical protein